MLSHIQKIVTPPVFQDDADKTRMASMLHKLLTYTIAFLVVLEITLAQFAFHERTFFLISLPILIVALGIDYCAAICGESARPPSC